MTRKQNSFRSVCADINVTPMADIMLVLLIIFMITTPMLEEGVEVNLPKANNATETEETFVVTLTREGVLYVNAMRVSDQELTSMLS